MPSNLDARLLEGDIDRLVQLADPEHIGITGCAQGGEECLLHIYEKRPRGSDAPLVREYTIVLTRDLMTLKRELVEFRRRWRESLEVK